jgi:hypothetical protein
MIASDKNGTQRKWDAIMKKIVSRPSTKLTPSTRTSEKMVLETVRWLRGMRFKSVEENGPAAEV